MARLPPESKPKRRPPSPTAATNTGESPNAGVQTLLHRTSTLSRTALAHLTALPRTLPHQLRTLSSRLSSSTTARRRIPALALYALSTWCTISLFRTYILDWSKNTGSSMVPTISSSGHTYTLYSGWYRRGRGIKVGDLVQIRQPFFEGMLAGKRVIGLPGDFVVRDKAMYGGVAGRTARGEMDGDMEGVGQEPELIQVPEGHVWLAGDNLAWSRDSRFYGPVPMALIRAKALFVIDGLFLWRAVWRDQMTRADGDVD